MMELVNHQANKTLPYLPLSAPMALRKMLILGAYMSNYVKGLKNNFCFETSYEIIENAKTLSRNSECKRL